MSEFKEHEIKWNDEKISRLWDFYSRTYPYNQLYFTNIYGEDILKKTEKVIGKLHNKVILDFGCGPGFLINCMKNLKIKPKKYIGLDFSKKSIEKIFQKIETDFPIEGISVRSLPSPLENNSIDVCFLIEVVEHLNDDQLSSTLKEIYRVLRSNGKLVITTPNNEDLRLSINFCPECGCIYHKWQHIRVWNKTTLEKLVNSYGFKTLTIYETNFITRKSILKDIYVLLIKGFLKSQKLNLFGIFEVIK